MHLNVKAKINLILNDFLKSNGAELMCKVKRHQFCFLQTKASLFFPFIQFVISFHTTTVFKVLYITLLVLVGIIRPTMQSTYTQN